jgi:hypothetical protein
MVFINGIYQWYLSMVFIISFIILIL